METTSESKVALFSLSSPPATTDFNFDSGCSTPYISAPSSPERIPHFFNSDSQFVDRFYCKFRQLPSFKDADEKQGVSEEMERSGVGAEGDDFVFDFAGKSDGYESVFAEELFDGGKIRPLLTVKPQINYNTNPKMSQDHRSSSSALSSRFAQSSGDVENGGPAPVKTATRSLSFAHETLSFWDMFPFSKQYRKWKLTNLLFRSSSEGRNNGVVRSSSATSSNRRRAETMDVSVTDARNDAVRDSSFRFNDSSNKCSDRRRRRAGSTSAHELHYTLNRAASEGLKRRTFLPYKQGLLGCLGFGQPTDVVSRVGLLTRG